MKNILVIVGSGFKNGNTDQLADAFIQGATNAGHSVKKAFLGNKTVKFCMGCNACRSNNGCILKDDVTELYPDYSDCDTIVLASPLYFWTISGLLKTFIDRLYGAGAVQKKQKDCVLLMTARQDAPEVFGQALSYYRFIGNYMGWKDRGMILAGGCGGVMEERLISRTAYLGEACQLGGNI